MINLRFTRETIPEDAKLAREEIARLTAELNVAKSLLGVLYKFCGHPKAHHYASRLDCPECGYGEYYGDR
jgi:hypothetical protein